LILDYFFELYAKLSKMFIDLPVKHHSILGLIFIKKGGETRLCETLATAVIRKGATSCQEIGDIKQSHCF